ncbi:MAG TPA: zf-HC2 domain-containing protein, partial [Spirochaetota bacterium]|nr:zf-HC2 domain-containing protein [Spirochaetota bacterium]
MKCSSVRSLIDSYLDGTCDEKKSRSVEEHTASCKDCAEELAYAKRVRDKMRSLSAIKAPAGFEEKIFRLTGTSAPSVGMKIIRFLNQKTVLIPLGSAAVIIMGLSIFLITDFRTGDKSTDKIVETKAETYDSKQAKGKISGKKKNIDTFAAKAPLESTPASKPS